ncbi:hypothetical protein BS17DRAFT_815974 [Gyrodon lividus]|nr:hypothetical protein BS17DRAFT_815974 [Gyrodon lividus]
MTSINSLNQASSPFNSLFPPSRSLPGDSPSLRAGSPSSTMTARRFDASPRVPFIPDDDPFHPLHHSTHTLRRRSSRLSRWLLELQIQSASSTRSDVLDLSDVDPVGTQCNPYLAYPHMSMAAVRRSLDDAGSMHDYVLVDDDDAQDCPPEEPLHTQVRHVILLPDTSPHAQLVPGQQSDLSMPLTHYDTLISQGAPHHPLQPLQRLAVPPGYLCSKSLHVTILLLAQTVHLVMLEVLASRPRCPRLP